MWMVVAIVGLMGCEPEEPGAVIVDLRTDLAPGIEFSAVRTEVMPRIGDPRSVSVPAFRSEDYVAARRVADLDALRRGTATLRVTLVDDAGAPVLERRSTVDLDGRVSVLVVLTRDCRGVTCDDPARPLCVAGQCVPEECALKSLQECGEAECDGDAACDAPAATCARATCAEGACLAVETPGECSAMEWCHPEMGCRPVPDAIPPDAGPRDGGGGDAGGGDAGPVDAGGSDAGAADAGPDTRCGWMGTQWTCNCPAGMTCDFTCDPTAASCQATCGETAAVCSLDCNGVRTCMVQCGLGGTCTLMCPAGTCVRPRCIGTCIYDCVAC